jgi:type IV pilus assembly protein PilW
MNYAPFIRPRRQRGFSIVELMVSVVIAMLALMFATRMVTGGERTKQAALAGSDSMQNGMLAMFSLSSDANQAGFGLNDPILSGCDTTMQDSAGFTLMTAAPGSTVHPLAPVLIESNGTAPDRITFYSGSGLGGTASVRLYNDFTGGTSMGLVSVPYGFSSGSNPIQPDVIVVAPESGAGKCSIAQVSSADLSKATLRIDSNADTRFNAGGLGGNIYSGNKTRIFNLGPADKLSFHTWSVASGFLTLRATDMPASTNTAAGATVADNIVSIKAQYGFDIRTGAAFTPENGMVVGRWSNTVIDADQQGGAGSPGDYQRVVAVRIAVVARSKAPERPTTGSVCDATTVPPTLFANAQPQNVAAVPVSVNLVVAGDKVDWKCYRYRVFDTIVPIRNNAWRPTAWAI